jgi:hypothetical protein
LLALVYSSNMKVELLTDADDIELETALQELLLNLLGDTVKANMTSWEDGVPLWHCHGHSG